jgi:hypothetical protein
MIGKVSLSVAVMTHPRRRDHAQKLAAALHPYPVDIVLDPAPDGPPESLRTAVRAWAAAGDATHHLVVQDDIVVTDGFIGHVLRDVVEFRRLGRVRQCGYSPERTPSRTRGP